MSQSAFITGATSGIGYATAKVLASRGYRLGIAARNSEKLEAVNQVGRLLLSSQASDDVFCKARGEVKMNRKKQWISEMRTQRKFSELIEAENGKLKFLKQ